ncbi:MAG TPA: ESX secretion-associated protein EspG [Pseudonocardiaceae bacterium]
MAALWQLTSVQLDLVWESLGLGAYPYPFQVRSHGATLEERKHLRQQVFAQLAASGLARGEQLHDELVQALRVLARPGLWLDLVWMPSSAVSPTRVLAIRWGQGTLLAVQQPGETEHTGGDLSLQLLPDGDLGRVVIAQLPANRPGSSRGARLPASAFQPSAAQAYADDDDYSVLEPRGRSQEEQERRAFEEIMNRPRAAGGQLGANYTDPSGRRHRSPVLNWFDLEGDGRYLLYSEPGPARQPWLTLSPADPARLHARLTTMIGNVVAG